MADGHSTAVHSRTCTKCGEEKPLGQFSKSKNCRLGVVPRCKACTHQYYLAHRSEIIAKNSAVTIKKYAPIKEANAKKRAAQIKALINRIEKRCSKCGAVKLRSDFYKSRKHTDGMKVYCKACCKKENRPSREYQREYRARRLMENPARVRQQNRDKTNRWNAKNPGIASRRAKLRRAGNPEAARQKENQYRSSNPSVRIMRTISTRIRMLISDKAGKSTAQIVGYTGQELREHLEKQFSTGMSWENYGDWHIDHIRPLSSFIASSVHDPDVKRAWALTNLRPLWAEENLRKHASRIFLI